MAPPHSRRASCDKQGHHPDVAFGWGYCAVSYTHEIGGLSGPACRRAEGGAGPRPADRATPNEWPRSS